MQKKKIFEIQFLRVVCAFLLILYHFSFDSSCPTFKLIFGGGPDGCNNIMSSIVVINFFMISGAVLFYNYEKIQSLKLYYYKRWKSIFVMFFILFILVFALRAIRYGKFFYWSEPWTLLFSLIGFDGYIYYYGINTYYICGEWFLGALLFVYAVYPLVAWLIRKFSKAWIVMLSILIAVFILNIFLDSQSFYPNFKGSTDQHLLSCLLFSYIGILSMKFKKTFTNKIVIAASFMVTVALLIFQNILPCAISGVILAVSTFIWLQKIGSWINKCKILTKFILTFAKLTLASFLLQHLIINRYFFFINPSGTIETTILFVCVLITILILSKLLCVVTNAITNSKIYLRFENKLLRNVKIAK